ncbi:MAG: hypothetical protein M1828_006977 [Chrysothrix sp. TS-e1954]|nr:MAG: hypothetical protein M1828_006977 [Chrysothrix sp. TS-e1954]
MTLPSTALQTSSTSAPTFAPVKSHSSSTVQPTSSRPASTTSSLLPQPTSKTVPAKTVVGAVIGSVVGLVLVIALLLLCCICLRRRRHRRRYDADGRSISTTASSPDVSTSRSNSNGTTRFPNTQRRISMLSPLRHAPRLSRTANDARRPLTASTVQTGPSWATPTTTRHPFMHSAETTTPLIPPQAFIPPRDPRYPPSMATPSSSLPRLTPLQQYQTAPYFRRQESINKPTIQLVPSSATTAPIKRKPIPTSSFSQPRLPSRTNTTITSSSNPSDNQPRTHIRQFEPEPPLPPALRLLPPSTSTFPRSQQLFPSPFPGPLTNSTAMSSQTPVSQRPPPTASSSRYTPSTYSTNANANNRLSRVSHSGYSQSHYSRLSNATTFTSSQESFDTRTGERRMSDPFDFDRESVVRQ